ncbi:hypothetical protein CDL15_Pgr010150 [Punica granatum]|uniref:Uncharacterized protein n=1 Tax=Punica granatum TaxID=22663 RepID=A0A218XQM4_PUNGR|nr:hypothetical protein CDL15_Pgr022384 [Punica granatum]OWM91120.1 hypothetical protein CDL15_Pgr010150 [Punica granatum]
MGRSKLPLRLWLADQFHIFLSSLPTKVIDPVVGEVDYGGCARSGGCPSRCAGLGLWRFGGNLVC